MSEQATFFEQGDGVGTLTFNRPEVLNAFNHQMVQESIQALKTVARDPAIRCLVITGSGRGFSSGQDLLEAGQLMGSPEASLSAHLRQTYHVLIHQIASLEKPVLAAINGVTAGIGLSIALAADLRVAGDQASFVLGFSKIGLIPDGGANWVLPRLIGYARAYQMAVLDEKVSAATALEWGLVNRIYPQDQLAENSRALALKLAAGPTLAYGLTKRAMRLGFQQSFAEALDYEAYLQDAAGRSQDCREGVQAFLEKRAPLYQGR